MPGKRSELRRRAKARLVVLGKCGFHVLYICLDDRDSSCGLWCRFQPASGMRCKILYAVTRQDGILSVCSAKQGHFVCGNEEVTWSVVAKSTRCVGE